MSELLSMWAYCVLQCFSEILHYPERAAAVCNVATLSVSAHGAGVASHACERPCTWLFRLTYRTGVGCRSEDFKKCFPGNGANELCSKHSWSTKMLVGAQVGDELRRRLREQPPHHLNWEWCWKLAQELGIPYSVVHPPYQQIECDAVHLH